MQQKSRQHRQIELGHQRVNSERLQGLLNVNQFAQALGWSPATVRMKVWKREVEFVRMGRSIRFRARNRSSSYRRKHHSSAIKISEHQV
jgi:hypothetical protein